LLHKSKTSYILKQREYIFGYSWGIEFEEESEERDTV
jgi:hypothetical protein